MPWCATRRRDICRPVARCASWPFSVFSPPEPCLRAPDSMTLSERNSYPRSASSGKNISMRRRQVRVADFFFLRPNRGIGSAMLRSAVEDIHPDGLRRRRMRLHAGQCDQECGYRSFHRASYFLERRPCQLEATAYHEGTKITKHWSDPDDATESQSHGETTFAAGERGTGRFEVRREATPRSRNATNTRAATRNLARVFVMSLAAGCCAGRRRIVRRLRASCPRDFVMHRRCGYMVAAQRIRSQTACRT